jgi:dynein heavy chain
MMRAGLDSKNSAFLLTDDNMKQSYVLQDVNNLLNQYDIPNIFGKEDKITIIEQSRMNARNEGRVDLYNSQTPHQLLDFFTRKVEKHLNVILCMSPTGSTLTERIRMFPSLVNCCTINWFTDWP